MTTDPLISNTQIEVLLCVCAIMQVQECSKVHAFQQMLCK